MSFMTKTYAKAVGFTAITEDELYYVNGGYNTSPSSQPSSSGWGTRGFGYVELESPVSGVDMSLSTYSDGNMTLTIQAGGQFGPVEAGLGMEIDIPVGTSMQQIIQIAAQETQKLLSDGNKGSSPTQPTPGGGSNPGYTGNYGSCGL